MQELTGIAEVPLARPRAPSRLGVHLLAILPLADVVLAQAQARLDLAVGPLSLAQAFHGAVLVLLLAALVSHWTRPGKSGQLPFSAAENGNCPDSPSARPVAMAAGFLAACVILSAAVRAAGGRWLLEDFVSDLKVLYWLAAVAACMVLCRGPADYRAVLAGLAAAGTYAAASVIAVQCLGIEGLSPYEGVDASAGGLNTAKGLGGILAAGGLVWVWLTRYRRPWLGAAGFALCYVALAMTYQRAGLVAGCAAVLWLAAWRLFCAGRGPVGEWAWRPLVLCLVPFLVLVLVLGTGDLAKRWSDLGDTSKAGSGRLAFWQEAGSIYGRADWTEKSAGIGYSRLLDAMDAGYGARIHTHSDVTDALVIYGALGLAGWLAVLLAVGRMALRGGLGRPAAAAGVAVFLVMALECAFTGQMFGPHVMSFYLLAICGVCLGDESQRAARPVTIRP